MVPLRWFQILRFFLILWLIRWFASFQTKCLLVIYFLCWTLFFLLIFFSLSSCYIAAKLHRERCWKVLLVGSLYFWWTSMLTPWSRNKDTMSYVLCVSSLNLTLSFLSALLYPHPSSIWGVLLCSHFMTSILQVIQRHYWLKLYIFQISVFYLYLHSFRE